MTLECRLDYNFCRLDKVHPTSYIGGPSVFLHFFRDFQAKSTVFKGNVKKNNTLTHLLRHF